MSQNCPKTIVFFCLFNYLLCPSIFRYVDCRFEFLLINSPDVSKTSRKVCNMDMEILPFEDVFPIENGDFPVSHVKFAGVFAVSNVVSVSVFPPPPGKLFVIRLSRRYQPTGCIQSTRRGENAAVPVNQSNGGNLSEKNVFLVELVGTQKLNFLKNISFSNLIEYKKNQHHLMAKKVDLGVIC